MSVCVCVQQCCEHKQSASELSLDLLMRRTPAPGDTNIKDDDWVNTQSSCETTICS